MRASFITGGLMTAFVLAASLPLSYAVSAADLDGEGYAEPPYDDGAYNDRGYNDGGYGDERDAQPGRYSEAPPPGRYDEPYDDRGPAEPPRGSIKDGYPVPMPPPRYGDRGPPERAERYACLDRWQIKRRLRHDGWAGIWPMGGDGAIVQVRARRIESGRPFLLRVDRCSGEVVAARPEYLRSFAFSERRFPERRWDRRW